MTEMAGNDVNISRDDYFNLFDQLVREWMTAGAESGVPQRGQFYGCQIPDCQCDGRIEIMEWGPEDMTETDDSDYEDSSVFDRPVTESVTARAGIDTDFPSEEHSEFFDRPVTESVTARAADTEQILVMNVSTVTTEQSENRGMVLSETNKRDIHVYIIKCAPERRQPGSISPGALRRVDMSNNQWSDRV